jgi:predicted ABC-type ATPase
MDDRFISEKNMSLSEEDLQKIQAIVDGHNIHKAWDQTLEEQGYDVEKGGVGSGVRGHRTDRKLPDKKKFIRNTTIEAKKIFLEKYRNLLFEDAVIEREITLWNKIVAKGITSESMYKTEDGTYTTERKGVHRHIVEKFFVNKKADGRPTAIFFGGPSGSGKSQLKKFVKNIDDYTYVNNDDIKEMLPEYTGTNASFLHNEARDVVDDLENKAIGIKGNIIIDGTMKSKVKGEALFNKYKEAGYKIVQLSTNLPLENTLERAVNRCKETGRYVPLEMIIKTAEQANINQFELLAMADEGAIFDSNVPFGSPLKKIARKGVVQ